MTWKDLANRILHLPEAVQQEKANVLDINVGEQLSIEELAPVKDWVGRPQPSDSTYTLIAEH